MAEQTETTYKTLQEMTEADVVGEIREAHRQVCLAIENMIHFAKRAGDLLIHAKATWCQHGDFTGWIDTHFQESPQTARGYMRVARNWNILEPEVGKTITSLRDAFEFLKKVAKLPDESEEAVEVPPGHIHRKSLIAHLEFLKFGISSREIQEQSACVIFKDGHLWTYNDTIACRVPFEADFDGAVQFNPFLSILRKLRDELLKTELSESGTELILRGKSGRQVGLVLEREVLLPVDKVEEPGEWKPLHPEFAKAVGLVWFCASKDFSYYRLACVNVTPEYLEACNNYECARYHVKPGLSNKHRIRHDAIKDIARLDMTEFSETDTWLHFRNAKGHVYSCRWDVGEYPNLDKLLNVQGTPLELPRGLSVLCEEVKTFSKDNAENTEIMVELWPDKLRIRGVGAHGWYENAVALKYEGEPVDFMISPDLLGKIASRYRGGIIAPERLKIEDGPFTYITALESAASIEAAKARKAAAVEAAKEASKGKQEEKSIWRRLSDVLEDTEPKTRFDLLSEIQWELADRSDEMTYAELSLLVEYFKNDSRWAEIQNDLRGWADESPSDSDEYDFEEHQLRKELEADRLFENLVEEEWEAAQMIERMWEKDKDQRAPNERTPQTPNKPNADSIAPPNVLP